jgi:hypothetical protein
MYQLACWNAANALKRLERVKGIEPSYSAWKAAALPLSYTRETRRFATAADLSVQARLESRYQAVLR